MTTIIAVDGNHIKAEDIQWCVVKKGNQKLNRYKNAYAIFVKRYHSGKVLRLTLWNTNESLVRDTYNAMMEDIKDGVEFIDPMEIMRELSE